MRVFALKSCDTCRKAIRELRVAGFEPQIIDVRADRVNAADLARFWQVFGNDLVNKRSTTWRNLTEGERGQDPLTLLATHPTLMKRPVIDVDGQLSLGWGADVRAKHLG